MGDAMGDAMVNATRRQTACVATVAKIRPGPAHGRRKDDEVLAFSY